MKTLILGLILGVACGYFWGYGEGRAGKPHVGQRALNKFGVSTIERTHRRIDAAIDSTGAK